MLASTPFAGMAARIRPNGMQAACIQRPNATSELAQRTGLSGLSERPGAPHVKGRQALPHGSIGRRSGHCEDPWGVTGGTQTHSRRTDRKLGQLRRARQELVRVPESNTKYGGNSGITGIGAAPVVGASISESSEIRNRKNFILGMPDRLRPTVHRPVIFLASGIALAGLTCAYGAGRADMPARVVRGAPNRAKVRRLLPGYPCMIRHDGRRGRASRPPG
jgi:hypothetical protein